MIRRVHVALALLLALGASACAGGQRSAFSYRFADNEAETFSAVVERLPEARQPTQPENALQQPIAVVTTHVEGGSPQLQAIDVSSGNVLWSRDIDARTRPEVLGDIVLTSERHQIAAFDLRTGAPKWTARLADLSYVGAARDGDTIYYSATVGAMGGARRVGHVAALDARTGSERWRHEVQGVFGQPAATNGMVIVPWERQNLAVLDEATGHELARLRSTDDVLAWAFQDPTGVYYGHHGIYRMTHRSISGTRDESTYRVIPMADLPRDPEIWDDGFLPKPGTRTARGRIRVYFAPSASGEATEVGILGDTYYFVYYRYVFGYDLEGNLRWARILDQDVIGAQPLANGIFVVGEQGQMRVLDNTTGADRWSGGVQSQLASVALDVAGFDGSGAAAANHAASLREQLGAVAVDPDNRLVPARAYAIDRLATLPDAEITRDMLDLYSQQSMPRALREEIGTALQARRNGGEFLVEALGRRYDFLEGTASPPLEVIVPSLLEMRATQAVPGLVQQLNDHETPAAVLPLLVRAIVELGDASVVPALRHFLVLYRADSTFAAAPDALNAAAEGIFRHGGPDGRALLTALAGAPGTLAPVAEAIRGNFDAETRAQEAAARAETEAAERALVDAARQAEASLPNRLSQAQIDATFAEHADPLRACVAAELERNPQLGQVRVVFILASNGRAAEIGVASTSTELVSCVQGIVGTIEFPRFRERRVRAQHVMRVRGGAGDEPAPSEGGPPAAAQTANWWTPWQRYAATQQTAESWWSTEEQPRPWWERRVIDTSPPPAPTPPPAPEPVAAPEPPPAAPAAPAGRGRRGRRGQQAEPAPAAPAEPVVAAPTPPPAPTRPPPAPVVEETPWWSTAGAAEEAEEAPAAPAPEAAAPAPPADESPRDRAARERRERAEQAAAERAARAEQVATERRAATERAAAERAARDEARRAAAAAREAERNRPPPPPEPEAPAWWGGTEGQ